MSRWKARLVVLAGYVGLAAVYAWPLPLYFWERVVLARGSDFYPHVWNLWWMRFSLLTLNQNPYHTDYLYFPTGLPLVYHVLDPLNGLLSIPLQGAFGLIAAFNLLRFAHLVFSAGAAYALCRVVGLPKWASWAGGALFMASPVASTSFDLGQLVEISTGWIPLYILCLFKALGNRALEIAPGGWGWILGAGGALAASFLATPYFFIALVVFTGLYVIWESASLLFSHQPKDGSQNRGQGTRLVLTTLAKALTVGALALLALSPLLVAVLRERATGVDPSSPISTVIFNSADLVSFFLPAPARLSFPDINRHEGTAALGLSVIALAAVSLVLSRTRRTQIAQQDYSDRLQEMEARRFNARHAVFWAVVALLFAILALGPHLVVAGSDTGLPMPFALFSQIPLLGVARVPLRFVLMCSLALSVLAAAGLFYLTQVVQSKHARNLLLIAVAGILSLELLGIPRMVVTPEAHHFWQTIAASGAERRNEGVLELPLSKRVPLSMYSATVHQHPIVSGYVARRYPYPWLDATPGIAQLADATPGALQAPDIVSPTVYSSSLAAIDYYGVRYVAVYATDEPSLDTRARETADLILTEQGVSPIFSDSQITLWKVPPQSASEPLVGLGEGWYGVEYRDDTSETAGGKGRWRWTNATSYIQLTNPTEREMPVTLTLAAYTFTQPRTLVLSFDGLDISRHTVSPYPAQTISVNLTLSPGGHWLQLQSVEPAEQPPGDQRLISIGFEQVAVEKRP